MSEKSDVVALEQILNYVAQEAQRLQLSPVVVHCLTSAIQMSAWRRYAGSESLP